MRRLLYACTCVCVRLQEGDSCAGSRVEVTGHISQGSVGAKTEEFILALPWGARSSPGRRRVGVTFQKCSVPSVRRCCSVSLAVPFCLSPASLFHYPFMFLTLCTSFFFYYPFLSFTLSLPEYIQFQILPETVSKTRFSCSYHLASLLYLSYKYWLYNYQSIISKHAD